MLFSGNPFVSTYFTPLAWTGYILFVDALVFRSKGASLIVSRPKEFLVMLPLSFFFWEVFEFFNLYIQNWNYVGLPEHLLVRWLGFGWAFATIWPAILETAEVLETWDRISGKKTPPSRSAWATYTFRLPLALFA